MSFDFKAISDACVKCGKCKPNCTIFKISGDETTGPRGFLDLVGAYDRGDLELDKTAKKIFESCFLCTNCVAECPSNLRVDSAIENIRHKIALKFGIAWYKRAFFWLLRHRKIMDLAAKMGHFFAPCAMKISEKNGQKSMRSKINFWLLKKERTLPTAAKKSFLNSHSEYINNNGDRTVGIFIGCMGNYAYTSIGEGLLTILKELKINAHLLKDQACCGAPAYFTGDLATVKANAKKNIAYFEKVLNSGVEAIIIPEATCSAMIKVDYEHVLEPEWQKRAVNLKDKIYMATEFFAKKTDLKNILKNRANSVATAKITYHDPCHARKMQGIFAEPRELLKEVYEIVEVKDCVSCCGFGGVTMQSDNYHLARKSGLNRAAQLNETGAKIVASECSACKMQLNNSLNLFAAKNAAKSSADKTSVKEINRTNSVATSHSQNHADEAMSALNPIELIAMALKRD